MERRSLTVGGLLTALLVGCGSSRCTRGGAAIGPEAPGSARPSSLPASTAPHVGGTPKTDDGGEPGRGPDDEGGGAASSPLATRLDALRKGGRKAVAYRAPSAEEEANYRAWMRQALAKLDAAQPLPSAPAGFVLEQLDGLWLLAEAHDARRGAGALALRARPRVEVLVEAPHTFFDRGTLGVAVAAFERAQARALLVNTVHRYRSREAGREGREGREGRGGDDDDATTNVESDVAHAPRSFFSFAHDELTRALPAASAVQLHGFAAARAPGVAAIVSAANTTGQAGAVAAALRGVAGVGTVQLYPDEARMLGGTTNAQAGLSRQAGRPFVHVEMSSDLRGRLDPGSPLLGSVVDAIVGALARPPGTH